MGHINRPIRVLMLLENNSYPGDTRPRREANSLMAAGYQVTVICPRESGQPGKEVVDGVTTYRYYAPTAESGLLGYLVEYGYSLAAMFFLSFVALVKGGFDVVHAHNPPDVLVLIGMFYKLLGKKFVFDHHDLSPELYNARFRDGGNANVYRALLFFEKLTFRIADLVISTNDSYREIAISRGNVPPERISVVRNGPELDQLQPVEPDPHIQERASILIGYLGAMGAQDGVDYFLRAAYHLVNDFQKTDFCAVLIGSGDAWDSLRELATELQLEDYIYFAGHQPDEVWRPMLASVDLCVVPDPSNPFNDRSTMIKITDYMALGKPMVAFDLPEHRVTAGDAALYAPPNDEREFAGLLANLMDDPQRRAAMGKLGQERIREVLSWNRQEEELCRAYGRLSESMRQTNIK